MGLDPGTKAVDNISGQVQNHGCRWENGDVIAGFLASDGTVALFNDREKYAKVQLLTVAGLSAVATQGHDSAGVGTVDSRACYVVADIPGGGSLGVQVTTRIRASVSITDPCVPAVRFMSLAAPKLLKR